MREIAAVLEVPTEKKLYIERAFDLDSPLHETSENEEKKYLSLDESLEGASKEEVQIYQDAGLEANEVNGRECLIRTDIDYDATDSRGQTNLERMQNGKPPLLDSKPVELHHIDQKNDAPLAELTVTEHRGAGNDSVLHDSTKESEIDRNEFKKEREQHWKARAEEILTERGEA